ncbi:hypothetical protein PHMEG_00020278 [Phytophthora megakarya]|uniref:Uncharacterized protein n=1 Tax=Phytophthora megakarya TaxID=4795 RepID=A0A225VS48_9STRA|nr:hypothetical protein PHMEG_00020278 [Phytophthora megakarya]
MIRPKSTSVSRIHPAAHKNCCKSAAVFGRGNACKALIRSGSWRMPLPLKTRPHQRISFWKRQLLLTLNFNRCARTRTRMSSIHTSRCTYNISANTSCISFWKCVAESLAPCGTREGVQTVSVVTKLMNS